MNTINLKNIVPDLKGRCKKLEKTYKILFPFSLLIIPAVPTMIVMQKYGVCAQLCRIVDMISMRDIVPLITVFGYASNAADAARKLIETGNLKGYRLVADTVLVKDGVELSEEEAIRSYAALFSPVAAATAGVSPSDMPAAMKKAAELYAANEAAMFRQAGQDRATRAGRFACTGHSARTGRATRKPRGRSRARLSRMRRPSLIHRQFLLRMRRPRPFRQGLIPDVTPPTNHAPSTPHCGVLYNKRSLISCRYDREEHDEDKRIYRQPNERR